MKPLEIKAPRHRFYSVYGLLLTCKARILNETDLDSSVLARGPLLFRFETVDLEAVKIGLADLRKEFVGEEFKLEGADS